MNDGNENGRELGKGPKRPIDNKRESAGSMEVGLQDEGVITDIYTIGDERLLMIKDRATYEIKFADKIDPERKNENIPNVQQRVLQAGSDHGLVRRVLLTSGSLFQSTHLLALNCALLRRHSLDALRELLAMERIYTRLNAEKSALLDEIKGQKLRNGFIVPSLCDLEQELKNFLQRADHFTKEVFKIVRIFEPRFRNLDKLLERAKVEKSGNEQFIEFLTRASPFLKFVREARNAVEHPSVQKRVDTHDFELDSEGRLIPPTIEVVHPKFGEPRVDLVVFMHSLIDSLATVYSEMIANLVARAASFPGFKVAVIPVPERLRPANKSDYMYAVEVGGEWQPIG